MKIKPLILVPILMFFAACEYNADEVYYLDVSPPDEGEIILNLAHFPIGATIYIYKRTKLYYQLTLPEGGVVKKRFSLDGEEISPTNDYFEFAPTDNVRYTKTLTVDIEIDARSESIAGKLGLENNSAKFEYRLVFVPNAVLHLENIAHRRNKDGYFELSWNKPELEQYTVDRYRISYYHNNKLHVKEIANSYETSFVDSMAVFGTLYYRIETFFKEEIREPWVDIYTAQIEFPKNSLLFEYTSVNSGRVSWPRNEYKCRYAFSNGYYGDIVYEGEENYFDIDDLDEFTRDRNNLFPLSQGVMYELYVVPFNVRGITKDEVWPIHYDVLYSPSIITIKDGYLDFQIFTDRGRDMLFVKNGNNFWLYDRNDLRLLEQATVSTLTDSWNSRAMCSESSSKIFLTFDEWIELVDYDFKSHEKMQFDVEDRLNYQEAFLGTNDVVYIKTYMDLVENLPGGIEAFEGKLFAYSLDTRELIDYLILPNKDDHLSVSRDGKYVAIYSSFHQTSEVWVYQFDEEGFVLTYHEDFLKIGQKTEPIGVYFNEKDPSLMIVTLNPGAGNSETYVVDLKNNMRSGKKLVSFVGSDPYTGNLLTAYGYYCSVFDQTLTDLLFAQERTYVHCLFNNYFFTYAHGGITKLYYLNIANNIQK